MVNIRLIILILFSSVLLSGCSLLASKKTTPTPTPIAQRLTAELAPFTTLTITADKKTGGISGHTFTMNLSNLDGKAKTLEYLLLYDLPDGRQQGIPGSIELGGKTSITRDDLLMGSCSKTCRFDEGVTKGTIELTYRDSSGGALGNILGDWHLQSGDKKLTSVDGLFLFQMGKQVSGWFVTMTSLGLPSKASGKLLWGPYTVTSSAAGVRISGTVSLKVSEAPQGATIYLWDGTFWKNLTTTSSGDSLSAEAPSLGTFIVATPS